MRTVCKEGTGGDEGANGEVSEGGGGVENEDVTLTRLETICLFTSSSSYRLG